MTFVTIHSIRSFPLSNLNRGEYGEPKNVTYGGVTRGRISSQAIKRAARIALEEQCAGERTFRSKHIAKEAVCRLVEMRAQAGSPLSEEEQRELYRKAAQEVALLTTKKVTAKALDDLVKEWDQWVHREDVEAEEEPEQGSNQADEPSEEEKTKPGTTLVYLVEAEIDALVRRLADDDSSVDTFVQHTTRSLSLALYGRMFAARPTLSLEAAVQVAHSFTTHQMVVEIDYFTAVDDLQSSYSKKGNTGAAHIDLAEYTTGTFYSVYSVDAAQLRRSWEDSGLNTAQQRLSQALLMMVCATPSGKQHSAFAATPPAYVLAEASSQPLSYAAAFERAVKPGKDGGGYVQPTIDTLNEYKSRLQKVGGGIYAVGANKSYNLEDPTSSEDLSNVLGWAASQILTS